MLILFALNISGKYIAVSVYTIALISVIVLPSLYVVRYNMDLSYLIISIAVVVANTVVLCLVFIPKVRQTAGNKNHKKLKSGLHQNSVQKSLSFCFFPLLTYCPTDYYIRGKQRYGLQH